MSRIKFENSPSTKTPINAENLNKLNNVVISPTEPTTGEEVWIKKGKNLFDGGISFIGYIDENGKEIYTSGVIATKYIKVVSNEAYSFSAKSSISSRTRIHGYNANKEWVSQLTFITTSSSYNATFTIPNDVEYIRISMPDTDTDILLEQSDTPSGFEPYIDKEIYVKNDNGVYEEFTPKIEQNIATGVEYKTGRIIDGKIEYGKRINCGTMPNNTTKEVSTGLENIKLTRQITGFCTDDTYYTILPIPYVASYTGGYVAVYLTSYGKKLVIKTGEDKSGYAVCYIDLYYTKN